MRVERLRALVYSIGGDNIATTIQDQLTEKAKQLTDCTQGLVNQHVTISQVMAQLADAQIALQKMHNDLQNLLNQYHDLLVLSNQQQEQSVIQMQPLQERPTGALPGVKPIQTDAKG